MVFQSLALSDSLFLDIPLSTSIRHNALIIHENPQGPEDGKDKVKKGGSFCVKYGIHFLILRFRSHPFPLYYIKWHPDLWFPSSQSFSDSLKPRALEVLLYLNQSFPNLLFQVLDNQQVLIGFVQEIPSKKLFTTKKTIFI